MFFLLYGCRPSAAGPGAGRVRRRLGPGRLFPPILLAAVATAPAGGPSTGPAAPGEGPRLQEVEKVRLVLLPASVTTRDGRPVRGLDREAFRVAEDGVPQPIRYFATEENAPIALAFLLDVSGSMKLGDRLGQAKRAIRTFVEALDADDRTGLICFADDQVTWVTEFTTDRERFLERLDVQQPLGRTALYDALAASPGLVDEEITGRKAIVLITDGLDNASRLPTLRAVWLARRVNVPIYTLGFIPLRETQLPRRAREALRLIGRFSAETGGVVHTIHRPGDLDRAVAEIQAELRQQYVIGYYPTGEWDGSFRAVELATIREGLTVRTRRGYYATP